MGLTDAEFSEVDKFIKSNTLEGLKQIIVWHGKKKNAKIELTPQKTIT